MDLTRHVDVLVIGAGPAGLSAAVRTRWVKGHSAISLKTAIVECGVPGGLVAWRGSFVTGPGFYLRGEDFLARMQSDLQSMHIPLCAERALRVESGSDRRFHVHTDCGVWHCDAVIVASGLRAQAQESRFFGQEVQLTYMGYDHFAKLFDRLAAHSGLGAIIVVVGNAHTRLLAPVLRDMAARNGVKLCFLLEGSVDPDVEAELSELGHVYWGAYLELSGEGPFELAYRAAGGQDQILACAGLLVDYNAYELAPQQSIAMAIECAPDGFYRIDRCGRTSQPFLYAAGDNTGGYAMVAGALAGGIQAGFAAYEDLYRERFAQEPILFAYRPTRVVIDAHFRALPVWQPQDQVEVLVRLADFDPTVPHRPDLVTVPPMESLMYFSSLVDQHGAEGATEVLDSWVQRKIVTVRRRPGSLD